MHDFILKTAIGKLRFVIEQDTLVAATFTAETMPVKTLEHPLAKSIEKQLAAYFQQAQAFSHIPITLHGTSYQQKVWRRLQQIPLGSTITYGELAKELNTSAQAIGNACRANPIMLIIPCHRVLSATGLGGYIGATEGALLDTKRWLLQHEKAILV
jgi:methylated-DNA-[protein]-cysteine S-methyltransferase